MGLILVFGFGCLEGVLLLGRGFSEGFTALEFFIVGLLVLGIKL